MSDHLEPLPVTWVTRAEMPAALRRQRRHDRQVTFLLVLLFVATYVLVVGIILEAIGWV
jgi:hypothetical protein